MKTAQDLRNILQRIDHKGYPAYKETKGVYQFEGYLLSIDHVQGDPFAAPSAVSVIAPGERTGIDRCFYDTEIRKTALEDYLLRKMAARIRPYSFKAKGSGKSGLIGITQPGQEILKRSACEIRMRDGAITMRMEIGFPANGRTIQARELAKILFEFLPVCVKETLLAGAHKKEQLERVVNLAEDQQAVRAALSEMRLAAFVANGAILPRKSGVSRLPMPDAVAFQAPETMEVAIELPHRGTIRGMGIPEGVTLIVGGGYHGKSTLLKALELGVYNHIEGDGREFVITREDAVKLRAEDGRSIQNVDISMFIRNLPNGKDTRHFYTEDASGSTSQAANTVEAMESGTSVFLIDEDTSATNFMIRDALMQRVVHREEEPIIPFIDRVREIYEKKGISTILVAGSCGSYFHKADCVLQMNRYVPMEITELAKKEAQQFPMVSEACEPMPETEHRRRIERDDAFIKESRIKVRTTGVESISINKETIDLRLVEQLVDPEQLNALGQIVRYMKQHILDGTRSMEEAVDRMEKEIEAKGFAAFAGGVSGNLAIPRRQEIFETLNRCRKLLKIRQ